MSVFGFDAFFNIVDSLFILCYFNGLFFINDLVELFKICLLISFVCKLATDFEFFNLVNSVIVSVLKSILLYPPCCL
jgi:hypothetical protein